MKTLLAFLFLGFISTSAIFAQENADVAHEMNKFLSKNLRYPTEARFNDVQGTVILQATFDELGFPLTTTVISGDKLLSAEVMRTISVLTENWKPEYLGDRNKGDSYLFSFQFKISKDRSPTQIHQIVPLKDQSLLTESPEKQLTSGLEANPYDAKLYKERAELYEALNLPVLAQKDLMLADYFESKMLTQILIIGYSAPNKTISSLE
jgi:hypothetical protein